MKELLNIATNFCATISEDGQLRPALEIAIITSEPVYSCDATGESIRSRVIDTYRLSATPKQARMLGAQLHKMADEAETSIIEAIALSHDKKQNQA